MLQWVMHRSARRQELVFEDAVMTQVGGGQMGCAGGGKDHLTGDADDDRVSVWRLRAGRAEDAPVQYAHALWATRLL